MTDKEIIEHSQVLRLEANDILNNNGLLPMLQTYRTTRVIGSYTLNTMTWPDIDISVNLQRSQDVRLFFEIGSRIAEMFNITKMSYSNHYIRNFPGFDHGLYWGIQMIYAERNWKIDLWGYDDSEYKLHMKEFDELFQQLQQVDRDTLLRLKYPISQRPDYRGDVYNSMAIYKAVITDNISSLDEFNKWIERDSHAKA